MARCTDCIHYEACLRFADLRVILCGDKADTKCDTFKPTADVAPMAELAREIFEKVKREITDALKSNYEVLPLVEESEALWNNANGKINALRGIEYFIEELEKKYLEAGDDQSNT